MAPDSPPASRVRVVVTALIFLALWFASAAVGLLALSSMTMHLCGEDPLTNFRDISCGPAHRQELICLFAWAVNPFIWLVQTLVPQRLARVRGVLFALAFVVPIAIMATVAFAFQEWWPPR